MDETPQEKEVREAWIAWREKAKEAWKARIIWERARERVRKAKEREVD